MTRKHPLPNKPKRKDFHEQRGVLKLFHAHGFDAAERDYYKAVAKRAIKALTSMASFNDEHASMHFKHTGSYSGFDEPGSVEEAREALADIEASKGVQS